MVHLNALCWQASQSAVPVGRHECVCRLRVQLPPRAAHGTAWPTHGWVSLRARSGDALLRLGARSHCVLCKPYYIVNPINHQSI